MANQTRSIHRGVDGREHRRGAINRSDYERAEHQILIPSEYCAVCFLTFGSQERRAFWGDKVAHPRCVRRGRRPDAG